MSDHEPKTARRADAGGTSAFTRKQVSAAFDSVGFEEVPIPPRAANEAM